MGFKYDNMPQRLIVCEAAQQMRKFEKGQVLEYSLQNEVIEENFKIPFNRLPLVLHNHEYTVRGNAKYWWECLCRVRLKYGY